MPIINQDRLTVSRALTVAEKDELLKLLGGWDGQSPITFDGWLLMPTETEISHPAPGITTLNMKAASLIR